MSLSLSFSLSLSPQPVYRRLLFMSLLSRIPVPGRVPDVAHGTYFMMKAWINEAISSFLHKNFRLRWIFVNTFFSIRIDIEHYISFRCIAQWLDLLSDHPDKSSTHLTPYVAIRVLLTIFPMLYLTFPWLFCNYQFVLLNSFTLFTHLPSPCPIFRPVLQHPSPLTTTSSLSVSMSLFQLCLFIYFVY